SGSATATFSEPIGGNCANASGLATSAASNADRKRVRRLSMADLPLLGDRQPSTGKCLVCCPEAAATTSTRQLRPLASGSCASVQAARPPSSQYTFVKPALSSRCAALPEIWPFLQ